MSAVDPGEGAPVNDTPATSAAPVAPLIEARGLRKHFERPRRFLA